MIGHVRKGYGAAAGTLARQIPLIALEFPEIKSVYHGSINLEFKVPLLVLAPDHRTKPIAWKPDKPTATEVFDLLRIEIEAPTGSAAKPAWLYIPHDSPHRRTPFVHEVIARELPMSDVTQCRIRINRPVVQIPWKLFPAVLVV